MLAAVNEMKSLMPFQEFYNEAINEHLEIKEDFPHWKAKEGFSFCNYPFILNPTTKSEILKIESMVQMRHELQVGHLIYVSFPKKSRSSKNYPKDAFFRAMFIGVNSPYLVLEIRRDHIIRDALYQVP
jgi:hypothetical protein